MKNNKMNLLLLCGNLSYAGAQRQLVELAKNINKDLFNVYVCYFSSKGDLVPELENHNIFVFKIDKKLKALPMLVYGVLRLIKQNDIQVIYSFLFKANLVGLLAKVLKNRITFMASERSSNYDQKTIEKVFHFFNKYICDVIIANTYAGKKYLITSKYPDDKLRVVYNGTDIGKKFDGQTEEEFILNVPGDAIVVGMIARIKPAKNYEMFLKVAEKVINQNNGIFFLAAGDSPYENRKYFDQIMEMSAEQKLTSNIIFAGHVKHIKSFIDNIDISILTSNNEGLSNAIIESMAGAKPLVVTDVGDNKMIVKDHVNGFVVPVNNIDEMARRIIYLAENKDIRRKIGLNNRALAESEFSTETMARKTEKIITSFFPTFK